MCVCHYVFTGLKWGLGVIPTHLMNLEVCKKMQCRELPTLNQVCWERCLKKIAYQFLETNRHLVGVEEEN